MANKDILTDRMRRSTAITTDDRFARAEAAIVSPTFQTAIAPNSSTADSHSPSAAPGPITTRLSFTMTVAEKETIDRIRLELFDAGGRKSLPSEGEVIRIALALLMDASAEHVAEVHGRMRKLVRGKGIQP